MEINGFDLDQPEEVCDFDGLDEDCARRNFQGKSKDEIDYTDSSLTEDLMWMNHEAFKHYLPGFLKSSLADDDGELASGLLCSIGFHLSGPREKRISFSNEQARTINKWFDLILDQYRNDEIWGFQPRIKKYRARF